jgi:nitrogen-specific signal transduction histidine kinase
MRHSVSIRRELKDGLPKVMGDRVQLQQVLMNLSPAANFHLTLPIQSDSAPAIA